MQKDAWRETAEEVVYAEVLFARADSAESFLRDAKIGSDVFQWYTLEAHRAFRNQFFVPFLGGELLQGSRPLLQFHKGFLHPKPAYHIAARIRSVQTVKIVA